MTQHHDSGSESLARPSAETVAERTRPLGDGHDPLSDVLRSVRLSGALFFVWDVASPYVTPVPDGSMFAPLILPGAQQAISYHIVTHGSAWGALLGREPVRLDPGDILLVPHGDAYVMSNSADTCAATEMDLDATLGFFRQMAAGEAPFVVEQGEGADRTRVICGFLGCDLRPFNPVLGALPPLVRLPAPANPSGDRLQRLIELTLAEQADPRPGSHCVRLRLSELMFVELVRRCLAEPPTSQCGWLAALGDPVVGPALLVLHRQPARPWTLETLAREARVSRSHLAGRFTQIVGQPPMQYLTRWRMQLAARLLTDGPTKVATVASEVGYASEAAFSRAFKRFAGASPAQWRAGRGERTTGL